ncbi:MAG: hypothetical protein E3K37_12530 [Candidatus Kuenenia sp.]|nr:hypothetical protein [Candidatus Kuenenia hertensis]
MKNKAIKLTIISITLFVISIGCAATTPVATDSWREYFKPGRTKEEITKEFNLYRGKWWNYYTRGRWYAEGGFYEEAIGDFKKAIEIRSKDRRAARSYGLHFWDYFGHRELGIAFYELKQYEQAKQELETSLATADSARAKFYLNKCNEEILKTTKADQLPPHIKVTSHTDGEIVNTPVVNLSGTVMDDYFVRDVTIQGQRQFIELAEKDLKFTEKVNLGIGENTLNLVSTDLIGKIAQLKFKLTLDMRPPFIYLDDIEVQRKNGKNVAIVKGTVTDDYGIRSFSINDTTVQHAQNKEVHFEQEIVLAEGNKISFRVTDIAGNETNGEQKVTVKASLWPEDKWNEIKFTHNTTINKPVLLAATRLNGSLINTFLASLTADVSGTNKNKREKTTQNKGEDISAPIIRSGIKSCIVYDKNFFFSGEAHDDNGIEKLFVNQEAIDIRPGKHVFFNYFLKLNDGKNTITVKAIDAEGNEAQLSPIEVEKKTFELFDTEARFTISLLPLRTFSEESRYSVALLPLQSSMTNKGISAERLYAKLLNAFDEDPKRFNFVERDQAKLLEILKEQKISNSELASPDTAIKIGKIQAAEGMLFGSVEEDDKGINVTLRLVDTETTQILANTDVYDEDKSNKNIDWLMYGLTLKMKQQFPMAQGDVIHVSGKGFHINVGANHGLSVGMKLLVFREINLGNFRIKEPVDVIARIVQVQPDTSFVKITSVKDSENIANNDMVITK